MFNQSNGLSLDQAPPLTIPLRFFITAPIISIIAGFFIVGFVDNIGNEGSLSIVILTHLLTLGFLAMVMIGAMFQMLPVLASVKYKYQNILAPSIHIALITSLLLFTFGFYSYSSDLILLTTILLGVTFITFIATTLFALRITEKITPTIKAFIFALISLFMAILIAIHLGMSHANGNISSLHQPVLYSHITFALVGWIGLLIIGVSFQVIPMFYVAKPYANFCKKMGINIIFASLFGVVLGLLFDNFIIYFLSKILGSSLIIGYGVITILRLKNRKRSVSDTTILYWYFGISMLLLSVIFSIANDFTNNALANLSVIIFIYGFAISVISGMLYKVVPFLTWFHLTNQGYFNMPTMNELINKKLTKLQFYLHIVSFISLVIFLFMPEVKIIFGVLLILSNALLLYNIANASKLYFTKKGLEKMEF